MSLIFLQFFQRQVAILNDLTMSSFVYVTRILNRGSVYNKMRGSIDEMFGFMSSEHLFNM